MNLIKLVTMEVGPFEIRLRRRLGLIKFNKVPKVL